MNASFHSAATGFPNTISWQWQGSPTGVLWDNLSDGVVYSGAMTDTLEVNVTDDSLDGWQYRAVASNGFLQATSNPATLTITNGTGG